jgi:hypothetical protein
LEEARKIHKYLGDNRGEAAYLGSLALVYRDKGDYENTMKCMREASKLQTGLKDAVDLSTES